MGRSRAGMKDGYEALCPPFVYSKQIESVVLPVTPWWCRSGMGACELMLANLLTKTSVHSPHSAVLQCRILARKGKQPEGESAAGGHAFLRAAAEITPKARVSGLCHCHGCTESTGGAGERLALDICLHLFLWC